MDMKMQYRCLAVALTLMTGAAMADDPQNLEFRGTLNTPPPCVLDETGTVKVSFGDQVGIGKVASGVYREKVPLTLTCGESSLAWQLVLTVTGNAAGFDTERATVVTAEQADLGVKLYVAGEPFELDTPLKVNGSTLPEIEAVLVQRDEAVLEEGTFTAQATLRAEYQ